MKDLPLINGNLWHLYNAVKSFLQRVKLDEWNHDALDDLEDSVSEVDRTIDALTPKGSKYDG